MVRWLTQGGLIVALTALSLTGGLAWGLALWFRWRVVAFAMLYAALWGLLALVAPLAGREALPCTGAPLRMQSPLYCALNRNYVTPELAQVARDAAAVVAARYPGAVTLALDGGFPVTGLPLIPHLSHDDGEKLDFAFFYTDPGGTPLPGQTRTPIGYWAFEDAAPTQCPCRWLTLRWSMSWLLPLWPERPLDADRTRALIAALLADARVGKVLLEPALSGRLNLSDPKLRFQGCRAARHDDHAHIQL